MMQFVLNFYGKLGLCAFKMKIMLHCSPECEAWGLQLKLLEVTSGDQVPLVTSEDYTNTIIFILNHL